VRLKRSMNTSSVAAFLLCLLIATASCGRHEGEIRQAPISDGKRSYEEFKQAVGSFPYTAPQWRQDRIRKGYVQVDVGATKDEIALALGDPDYSQNDYSKEAKPGWIGSSWVYYIAKKSDGANVFDPVIHVFFGTDGRATWIVPRNIEGLNEKGSPSRRA
jgi:hypothetical protein